MPGIRPFCSGAEMYFQIFQWGHPGLQAFWVNDAQATPLATYAETGQVAMAEKRIVGTVPAIAAAVAEPAEKTPAAEWKSVYVATPQGLSDDLLNRIARESGAYVAGPAGHYLCLSGEFASLHALRTGSYTLTLPPGRSKVLDADTGQVLMEEATEFTFPVVAQQTYWFVFQ